MLCGEENRILLIMFYERHSDDALCISGYSRGYRKALSTMVSTFVCIHRVRRFHDTTACFDDPRSGQSIYPTDVLLSRLACSIISKVDSTLPNSVASPFSQSNRLPVPRDFGVPGPGSYRSTSSLGRQVRTRNKWGRYKFRADAMLKNLRLLEWKHGTICPRNARSNE